MMKLKPIPSFVFGAMISLGPAISSGAVLTGNVITTGLGTGTDLSASGTTNWAIWDNSSGTDTAVVGPTNTKAGGPTSGQAGFISSMSSTGTTGTNVRGGADGTYHFSYTDGANSPTTLTDSPIGLIFDASLDGGTSEGVTFTVTGDPGQIYRVSIWATGYTAQGKMTASLAGATPIELFSQTYAYSKTPTLFTFDFMPDNPADLLTLSYTMAFEDPGAGSSHVGIQAVTVEAIPEPSVLGLGMLAALGLAGRRRR